MSDEPPSPDVIVEAGWLASGLDLDRLAADAVGATLPHVAVALGEGAFELAVRFTDDATITALNAEWRGQAKPTDVLSFPATEPDAAPLSGGPPMVLGDIVLGFETCARDADELERPLGAHVSHLVVHGLLHLFHHDHRTAAEAEAMEELEVAILADLGLDDPYRGRTPLPESE